MNMKMSHANRTGLVVAAFMILIPVGFNACNKFVSSPIEGTSDLSSTSSGAPIVAGNGDKAEGTGALSVPTTNGVVMRVQNGLQGNVKSTAGNFRKALQQVQGNLPKVSDPTQATGFDQVQLLVYAACSDLTTGGTPLMQSKYGVKPASSISANQAALIQAGLQMLDQYTAGLASSGPTNGDVKAVFTDLVKKSAADSTNTSKIAFMTVCIAANSAGSTMLGF